MKKYSQLVLKNCTLFLLAVFFACSISFSSLKAETETTTISKINNALADIIFFDFSFGIFDRPAVDYAGNEILDQKGTAVIKKVKVPLVVIVLFLGGLYFTIYFGFINLRGFKHAILLLTGKLSKADDQGEISHFKALTTAVSATVGLGNIAGVAIAIQIGGPGATFWMIVCGFIGMSSKFAEVTLAQMYRKINKNGTVSGGPMFYLDEGFKHFGGWLAKLGKAIAIIYAFLIMFSALGGACMFQSNQIVESVLGTFQVSEKNSDGVALAIGIGMALLVGSIIFGGIKKIGTATSKIAPAMCFIYVVAALFVIAVNYQALPTLIPTILAHAFDNNAFAGGFVGVFVAGIQRAAFSNEAGLGSASITHAAAKTNEPVREGLVALLEPFIDTIIICTLTATVIIVTGTWNNPSIIPTDGSSLGVTLTAAAFNTVLPWFSYVLSFCVFMFAFSTMISWCYYGERGWVYVTSYLPKINGEKTVFIYRLIFLGGAIVGAVNSLDDIITLTDMMFLSLAIPNVIGCIILSPQIKKSLNNYWKKLN